jgi:dimeric dUTPase (all-alpha-NTP-PPase superfamily)
MVENRIVRPHFKPFFYAQLHVTASVFPHNKLRCLILWNEFKVSDTLDFEESFENCLHFSWIMEMSAVCIENFVV